MFSESGKLNGQAAWVLTDRFGSDGAKLYVSADGKARLLRVAMSSSTQRGALDFTDWDAVPPVTAPSAAQIVAMLGAH